MKKYKIKIPKPSAKRLNLNRKLLIEIGNAFKVDQSYLSIPNEIEYFEFEWLDELEHIDEERLDADYRTRFFVEFENATGTRKEMIKVEPKEMQ